MEDSIRNNKGQYKKGYSYKDVPIEIRMKIIEKNKEAWRNKPEYIGDIVAKYPKIHNVWRSILYTKKGIKAGHSKEWDNFKIFFYDVINTYKPGLLFRRLDSTKPFSKDNFIWVTKEEAQLLKSNLVWLEYNGEKLPLKDWADKTGNSLYGIKNRYYKREKCNYTIEEIIFGRKVKRGSKKVAHDNLSRSKASRMISAYKIIDKKNGYEICDFDIDWMLENIVKLRGKRIVGGDPNLATKNEIHVSKIAEELGISNQIPQDSCKKVYCEVLGHKEFEGAEETIGMLLVLMPVAFIHYAMGNVVNSDILDTITTSAAVMFNSNNIPFMEMIKFACIDMPLSEGDFYGAPIIGEAEKSITTIQEILPEGLTLKIISEEEFFKEYKRE